MTKIIKIPADVHTELKSYVAVSKDTIEAFAGLAIMNELAKMGHKFVLHQSKSKKQKKSRSLPVK